MSARLAVVMVAICAALSPADAPAQVKYNPTPPPPPPPVFETSPTHLIQTLHKPVAVKAKPAASPKDLA
jgi:hypothetical protein